MGSIWLLGLLLLSAMAVITAKGIKWKLINLAIILGFIGAGISIGAGLGAWGQNMAIGGELAVPLAICFGAVGALGCWRRNRIREKAMSSKELTWSSTHLSGNRVYQAFEMAEATKRP
jgi:hypothetical protein